MFEPTLLGVAICSNQRGKGCSKNPCGVCEESVCSATPWFWLEQTNTTLVLGLQQQLLVLVVTNEHNHFYIAKEALTTGGGRENRFGSLRRNQTKPNQSNTPCPLWGATPKGCSIGLCEPNRGSPLVRTNQTKPTARELIRCFCKPRTEQTKRIGQGARCGFLSPPIRLFEPLAYANPHLVCSPTPLG